MTKEIKAYNAGLGKGDKKIADLLCREIDAGLGEVKGMENKIWYKTPVWFIDGNPIVGYSRQKPGMRLMFWSGADFGEKKLDVVGKKFKDASIFYTDVKEVDTKALAKWLRKSIKIQWDYKNIVKRKGKLVRLS